MIIPYALMMDDPTTSVMICWIDERAEKDGGTQTLAYNGEQVSVLPWATLANGDYIYRADLVGLSPATEYSLTVHIGESEHVIKPVRTLPTRLPESGIKILCVQDTHANARQMTNPATFAPLANEQVDLYVIYGDALGALDYDRTSGNADVWKVGMRDYILQVNKEHMPHIIQVPGNHEVGNTSNDGTTLGDATGTQFRQFFPNQYELTPANTNHAAVKVGDYLQVLGGDSYSGYPHEIGALIKQHHDPRVALCLYGSHSPMFSAFDMRFVPQDNLLQERMRNECFAELARRHNVKFTHCGNIHLRTTTWPMTFVTADPGETDSLEVGGENPGWIVRAAPDDEHTLIEFGQGWMSGREGTIGMWFFEEEARDDNHHFIIDMTPGGVRQRCVAQDLSLYGDRTWPLPRTKTAAGYVSPKIIKAGAWRYQEARHVVAGQWQ